jgi:hypothetical protein
VSVTFTDSQHTFQTPGGQSLTSHCPPARLSRYKSRARVAASPTFAPRRALGLNRGNLSRWLVQTCAACHCIAKDFITPRTIAGGDGNLDWYSHTHGTALLRKGPFLTAAPCRCSCPLLCLRRRFKPKPLNEQMISYYTKLPHQAMSKSSLPLLPPHYTVTVVSERSRLRCTRPINLPAQPAASPADTRPAAGGHIME